MGMSPPENEPPELSPSGLAAKSTRVRATNMHTLEELQHAINNAPSSDVFQTLSAASRKLQKLLHPIWPVPEEYAAHAAPSQEIMQALTCIIELNAQEELFAWYQSQIVLAFLNVECETKRIIENYKDPHDIQLVLRLVTRWHVIFLTWYDPLRVLSPGDTSAYELYSDCFYSSLISCIPDSFPSAIKNLFRLDLSTSPLLFQPTPLSPFSPLIERLATLGLLKRFQPILFSVGYDAIDERIETICRGEWLQSTSASLQGMLEWFRQEIGSWLLKVLEAAENCIQSSFGQRGKNNVMAIMHPAMSRFEYHIYKGLSELRINELFDIIVDFPDTMPVLQDLRLCLNKIDHRSSLIHKLREANTRRLLHPGADTQDIITQYISVMKALRVLDPPGVLLSCVAHPVRLYLRNREDTIRCIVSSLVEPGHTLEDELDQNADVNNGSRGLSSGLPIQEEIDYYDPNWMPDPVDAPIGYKSVLKDDVIESLVSIYENRDGFVKELQNLLASRLLAVKGFDVTQELTRIEILKGKFGEANLQPCDIMLKDLSDSKRVDSIVHELIPKAPIHPIIISHLFWPNLVSFAFRVSPQLLELLKAFEQTYTSQKVDRRLRWLPQLGTVEIDLEVEDRTLSLEVTTLQASVIELFGTSDTWTINQLRDKLRLRAGLATLNNALCFWSNQEVLKEIHSGVWKLFETRDSFKSCSSRTLRHVIENPSLTHSENDQEKAEKLKVMNACIIGMVTNLGTLSFDRILNTMNTVLVSSLKGTVTKEDLLRLLQKMEREGSLIQTQNQWKLAK